jgi:farnesyl diphosphate synthase
MTKQQRFHLKAQTEKPQVVSEWQDRFESVLERRLPEPTVRPAHLHQAMRYAALDGGKRFRPVLIYASGRALGVQPSELDSLACAIELIHAYSLIHDDLPAMDDDDLRRGRPSCHKAFDEATAILAGDALQALAFEILARELSPAADSSLQLIGLIATACGSTGMAGGQALDLAAVGNDLTLSQLETMHQLKTGALIHAAVMAPCLLFNADEQTRQRFSTYGKCVGLAFQVHDDILDVTGDSQVTGKLSQADSALNKPTFPSILGLEESRQRATSLRNSALAALDDLPGDTSIMAWLASYVISRDR